MTLPAKPAIIFPVSERNNNEIRNMKNQIIIAPPAVLHDGFRGIAPLVITNDTHEVTCCLCGSDEVITCDEVGQWDHGIENFECSECE